MATIETLYGTAAQSITIAVSALANNSARQSNVIQNSGNNFVEVLCQFKIGAQGASSLGVVNIYAYGTVTGSQFTGGAVGSDSAITINSVTNLRLLGTVAVDSRGAGGSPFISHPMPVSNPFGGVIPSAWGVVVENKSGASLAGSEEFKMYQGIKYQQV